MSLKLLLYDDYYSIGALQSSTFIEKWMYTDDRYDRRRLEHGFVFKTKEEAEDFLKKIKEINNA